MSENHSKAAIQAALKTLQSLNYTYLEGAEQWKPPLGLHPTQLVLAEQLLETLSALDPKVRTRRLEMLMHTICDRYESGYGHGLHNDGLDLSKTPHGNEIEGMAYQFGYEQGQERYRQYLGKYVPAGEIPTLAEFEAHIASLVDIPSTPAEWMSIGAHFYRGTKIQPEMLHQLHEMQMANNALSRELEITKKELSDARDKRKARQETTSGGSGS